MSKLLPFRHWFQPNSADRRRRLRRRAWTVERLEQRSLLASIPIELEVVTDDLSSPVVATHAGDDSGRIFVAQQGGAIRIVRNGQVDVNPFLDLGSGGLNRILSGGERGLLGLAFHPDFQAPDTLGEGKFYVYYSAPATFGGDHDSVISEFQVSANPNLADPTSERILLRFNQPFSNHNGGDLHFGPDDGQLYVSSGDGGSGGDPQNNAQNLSTVLGKILRIDVDGNNSSNGQYGIPTANPFVGQLGAREEIFAYGFRNPFRFSFDDGPNGVASADRLFAGDVGQNAWEEIDLVTSGGNYGWRIREGKHPFSPNDPNPGNLIEPIAEYPNDQTTAAVIGGFVYRGTRFPQLQGQYLFADLSGKMFGLEQMGNSSSLFERTVQGGNPIGENILGMGQDEANELYVLTPTSLLAIEAFVPWQNPVNRLDVNNDTLVSPVADILPMINELNLRRLIDNAGRLPDPSQPPALFYDVNGDGFLTAAGDVLPVINFVNQSAEPESAESCDGDESMESSDEPTLEQLFPNLASAGYEITSPATRQYNCVAWAAGYHDIPWDHNAVLYAFWPRRIPNDGSTGSLVAAFGILGYTRCDNGELEEGFEKIAIYGKANDDWTHAARQLADGCWTSKLGGREDIRHKSPYDLVCDDYGRVVCCLVRRRQTA